MKTLFDRAKKGDLSILDNPQTFTLFEDAISFVTPFHYLVQNNSNVNIFIKHPLVNKLKDYNGATPLHWLAYARKTEILKHPSVDKLPALGGQTPLHYLANEGCIEIITHPSMNLIKDSDNKTPLDLLLDLYKRNVNCLKRDYSQYPFKDNEEINLELFKNILKFIKK